jgi:hypothetical protein
VGAWVVSFDNWESEAQIGGSRSAGTAKPGWTDLECLLGLLPNFRQWEVWGGFRRVLLGIWNKSPACFPLFIHWMADCD